MRTLVVIPTYQEAENIADVLARSARSSPSADVLVVDDNSPDGYRRPGRGVGLGSRRHLGPAGGPKKDGLGPPTKAGFAQASA